CSATCSAAASAPATSRKTGERMRPNADHTTRKRWVLGGLLSLCLLLAQAASAQVSVHAYVDKTVLGDAEMLLFTVEASGDFRNLGRVTAPTTRGLEAVQTSPVQRWDVSVLGGRTHQKLTLQWQYRPLGTGTAYVGDAVVRIDGEEYTTDPIVVTVVSQS